MQPRLKYQLFVPRCILLDASTDKGVRKGNVVITRRQGPPGNNGRIRSTNQTVSGIHLFGAVVGKLVLAFIRLSKVTERAV